MEKSYLDPAEVRKLALRIFGDAEFKADPKGTIIRTLDWLDEAASGDSAHVLATASSAAANLHALVKELATYITAHGLSHEVVAREIGVSAGAITQWLHGIAPKASSLEKIRVFLKANAAGPEQPGQRADELFGRQPTPDSSDELRPETETKN